MPRARARVQIEITDNTQTHAFIREPLAGPPGQLKNEAAESCLESITTTGRTNFFGFPAASSAHSARKEMRDPGIIIESLEPGPLRNKIEQKYDTLAKLCIAVNHLNKSSVPSQCLGASIKRDRPILISARLNKM